MKEVRITWDKFKSSRVGWAILVTTFAIGFGLLASLVAGILILPWLLNEGSKYSDELLSLAFPLVILGLAILFTKLFTNKRGIKWQKFLKWKKPKKNALWITPLALLVYLIVLIISMVVLQVLSPSLAGQEQEVAKTVSSSANWQLVLMVVSVGIITPIAEETLFRGLLLSLYSRRLKIITSIIIVATLFGFAHGQVNVGIDTFFFGLTLGFVTWQTESIYPAVLLHMLKNCLAIIVLTYS